jgi:hypothetical protein
MSQQSVLVTVDEDFFDFLPDLSSVNGVETPDQRSSSDLISQQGKQLLEVWKMHTV